MNTAVALYSAVGEEFTRYEVDLDSATLIKRESIKTPTVVQYAWPHPSNPHQVRITPSNRTTIIVDRGNSAKVGKPEEPGTLRLFRFNDGVHSHLAAIAPNGGYGFGPRHLDFHPTKPWVYVSLELQSLLHMYRKFVCNYLIIKDNLTHIPEMKECYALQ